LRTNEGLFQQGARQPLRGEAQTPSESRVADEAGDDARPAVLMLGKGWFPATLGGLDRYFRLLFEQLPEARGVVLGPATDAPPAITVVGDPRTALPRRLLAFWRAAQRDVERCDLVDAHFALYAAAPLVAGRLRGRPVVFHFHGPWAEESVSSGDTSRSRLRLRRALERRALERASAFVVLSGAFRRLLVERYRVPPWDVHVLVPGVSLDVFSPGDRDDARARLELGASAFVVACARRLVPRMGLGVLLDAWAELDGELPDGSTLLIVGGGPLHDELARRAATPRLAGRVRILGELADASLADVFRAADVAAVPSLAFEGYGLVVLEAAACGTPSLVSDLGGLPEAVCGLDPTLVVPCGDVHAWARRLRSAAAGTLPPRSATRRYAERFDWPSVAQRHRALYASVAKRERDQRIRVVYLTHVARMSGAEIALLRLLPHLSEVNAHVILGEDGPLVGRLHAAGISVEVLPMAASAREVRKEEVRLGGAPPAALAHVGWYAVQLARRLRQLRPDLVHANSLKAGVYGGIAAQTAGLPFVWQVHDRIATDYLPRPAVAAVRFLLRHLADGVVANSMSTLGTLGLREGSAVSAVLPNAIVAPERTGGGREPAEGDAVAFAMVGRITPWKGQDLFLRAFAQAFPDGQQRAVVVGSAMFGEEEYERELIALAASLGLDSRVEFRGFRENVFAELASVDVLVHASVIPEPFGQVVLEGMAAGMAVIAADAGGPAELITDAQNGRLFRTGDADSLARTMRELADDQSQRRRLGAAALASADAYEPAAIARQLTAIYRRVLQPGR
jgi:glycosyltransferase involved in cell wall biosynthesis